MDSQTTPQSATLAELLLSTVILTLKILIPMLWLQSKLSPIQFFISSAALVLFVFFFDLASRGSPSPRRALHPRTAGPASSREMDASG